MKHFFSIFQFFLASVFILLSGYLMAQSADFCYKERGKSRHLATIYFSDGAGNENVSPEDFKGTGNIYFTIKTNAHSEREFFRDKDIEECFVPLRLIQDGKTVKNAAYPRAMAGGDGKISMVVLSYDQSDVKLFQPFVFVNAFDTTKALVLRDVFYNSFDTYKVIYEESLNMSDRMEYIPTFNQVLKIINDASQNEEIKHYSFFKHASEVLMENAIQQHSDSLNKLFTMANTAFLKSMTEKDIHRMDSVYALMANGFQVFKPYFNMSFPRSKSLGEMYASKLESADKIRFQNYDRFKSHVLSFLEKESYDNYQFKFFIDVLARMVTHLDTLRVLNGLDTLRMLTLNKLPQQKKNLLAFNWHNDFRLIVQMLNKDIIEKGKIFNDSMMNNLQRQKSKEHQPYFEIFLAFNRLSNNQNLFRSFLKTAIVSCTDMDLINNFELWVLSSNLTTENLSPILVQQINKGILRINQRSWDEAFNVFTGLTRQANNSAPSWYYLGRSQFEKGEAFSSENKFERALDLYPEYVAPRLFTFRILREGSRNKDLLDQVELAIVVNDIWIFRYWKAQTLFDMGKNKEAISEIENYCIKVNPYNLDQYFLLGDAYKAIKKYKEAEDAYRKTYEIDIFAADAEYNARMELLQQERNR